MAKLRACCFTISIDGYGAGPGQTLAAPMGAGGERLHSWFFPTKAFQEMVGGEGGSTGIDQGFAEAGFENIGAWIMGRNMFAHSRGPWTDDGWEGWWGEEPPYHCDTYVLTHHARPPLAMAGGTVFHFVTEGIQAAYDRAMASAGGKDVRLGGGVSTVRQYMRARLLDELHLAISPTLLGAGEALFAELDAHALGYCVAQTVAGEGATHVVLAKS